MLGKTFQNKVRRLERARHQRDRLIRELEEVWSFLEDGIPGLETDLEPHSMEAGRPASKKRKRSISREDEARRLEDELEDVRVSMMELRVELEGDEELKKKDSLKIPAEQSQLKSPVKEIVVMFEELNVNVRTVDDVEKHTAVDFEKSPLKLLIGKYENMRVENESTIMIGQSEADVSRAKPKCQACAGRCQV